MEISTTFLDLWEITFGDANHTSQDANCFQVGKWGNSSWDANTSKGHPGGPGKHPGMRETFQKDHN